MLTSMVKRKLFTPITWPVLSFALVILLGALLLGAPFCWLPGVRVSWIDALFLSTSAVCVTGLATLDIGSTFNFTGLLVLLGLIQLGGLGITTYTSLVFILWRNRVPFNDRLAVSQALLSKDIFDLRAFVLQVTALVVIIEGAAALLLWWHDPVTFYPFSAIFHAISAFCNAGFGLLPDNLVSLRDDLDVNLIIGVSIVAGGLGFAVLRELFTVAVARLRHGVHSVRRRLSMSSEPAEADMASPSSRMRLDRYSRLVLGTSLALIVGGGVCIYAMEVPRLPANASAEAHASLLLAAFFQSVSARTAGFSSVDLASFSDASLLVLVGLMFIGGSPGSCAGGIKTTTFRVLTGFVWAQLRGDKQIVLGGRAVQEAAISRALTLFFFAVLTICLSVVLLCIIENGMDSSGNIHATPLISIVMEVVSALGTVGLSVNLTPHLSNSGKSIIILNMFIGRVGFITLLAALQSLRPVRVYEYAKVDMPIG